MKAIAARARYTLAKLVEYDTSQLSAGPLPYDLLKRLASRQATLLDYAFLPDGDRVWVVKDKVMRPFYLVSPEGYRAEHSPVRNDVTELVLGGHPADVSYCAITQGLLFDFAGRCLNPPRLWRPDLSYSDVRRHVLATLVKLGAQDVLSGCSVVYLYDEYKPFSNVFLAGVDSQQDWKSVLQELRPLGHELGIFQALEGYSFQTLSVKVPALSRHDVLALLLPESGEAAQ